MTELSFAFVNTKPVLPGHVLVSPRRVVPRFADTTTEEVSDLWTLAQRVGKVVERHYGCQSLTMAIQDGPMAGQTVPHVHIHLMPRKAGDFKNNDDVYDAMDASEGQLQQKLDLDKDRKVRTADDMAAEAAELRKAMVE